MMIHTTGRRFGHASPIGETIHTLHDVVQAGYLDYVAVGRATCNGHLVKFPSQTPGVLGLIVLSDSASRTS
ncbi:hypothetical protein SCP_0412980 [Sparassis crispa]|uniref:Uncharacterized protein n=1 Tax=Sparassis crispa TaxID=139825 RepID=A0A401GL63_9APHY|nr:hypothetical protein SCP_0412980 [Sparassis crispa]GBE82911.1 hypothetical protein SCP_0412980 [Sparassis crispa]